jgi:bifunctional non-homologous end joining protein LigD
MKAINAGEEGVATKSVNIDGKRVKLTNIDKILYPSAGFTKGEVIDYYVQVAPTMLPHLKGRSLTMKRFPEGVDEAFFYEKRCPGYRPKWMETVTVASEQKTVDYCVINDLPSLVWVANLASLEMHTSLSLSEDRQRPTVMVFDLDPGPPAGLLQCLEVALKLREIFQDLGLESFPKTSGGKGLHLFVPLNNTDTYDKTKSFAQAIAQMMEKRNKPLITSNMRKELRRGKVFMDWSQNDDHKTTVCAYSLRAQAKPTVSVPVEWRECEKALKRGDTAALFWGPAQILKRIQLKGDLFDPVLNLKQELPSL